MSSAIDVAVAKGQDFIRWARNRPARVHPSGCVGAVFEGLVMPVYRDRFDCLSIDLNDEGYDPSDCAFWPGFEPFSFLDDSTKTSETGTIRWHLETNTFGHYVVFDGDEQVVDSMLKALEQVGLGIRRHGESTRPADDGYHYDWFIRLEFEGSRADALEAVETGFDLLRGLERSQEERLPSGEISLEKFIEKPLIQKMLNAGVVPDKPESVISWLAQAYEVTLHELERTKIELQEEVDRVIASERQTTIKLKREQQLIITEKFKLENRIKHLSGHLEAIEQKQMRVPIDENDLSAAQTKIKDLEAQLEDQESMYAIWAKLEEEKAELSQNLTESALELRILAQENNRLAKVFDKPSKNSNRLIKAIRAGLSAFGNIRLHGDAADTIASYFPDPTNLFNTLARINAGEKISANKLKGIEGNWFEIQRHIATGGSSLGRLYYRVIDGVQHIVVHCKKNDEEQKRFIKGLGNPRFMQDQPFD